MKSQSYAYDEPETGINLSEVLWGLLDQWKLVLLVAFVTAALIPTVKLLRDRASYEASLKQAELAARQVQLAENGGLEEVLSTLSDNNRSAVELLIQQQEAVSTQSDYLNNSILLSIDPANQRTLYVRYRLTAAEGVEVVPLADAYSAFIKRITSIQEIGNIIAPDAAPSYINELVNIAYSTVPDSAAKSVIVTISVVLPDKVDADAVTTAINGITQRVHEELNSAIGAHTIEPLDHNETRTYNNDIVARKTSLVNNINNLRTAMKTNLNALNPEQKAAYDSALQILNAARQEQAQPSDSNGDEVNTPTASTAPSLKKPSFSKKLTVEGFAVGVVLYAIAYIVLMIIRNQVVTTKTLTDCTKCRLLGELYYPRRYRGLDGLVHSRIVNKLRYGKQGEVKVQIDKAASTTSSVCEHVQIDSIHIINLGNAQGVVDDLVNSLKDKGIKAKIIAVDGDSDEKTLLPIKDAVYVVNSNQKTPDVYNTALLCRSYDIRQVGCIFVRGW